MAKLRGSIYTFPEVVAEICGDILKWMEEGEIDLAKAAIRVLKKNAEKNSRPDTGSKD